MSMASIQIEDDEFKHAIDSMSLFTKKMLVSRNALEKIGHILENSARQRIQETKRDPQGEKWPIWSKKYEKTRNENQSLLMNRGAMLYRLSYKVIHDLINNRVIVGSTAKYSSFHQLGTKKMPKREFLGVSKRDSEDILDALYSRLRRGA